MATEKDNGGPAFPCKGTKRVFLEAAMEAAGLPHALAFANVDFTGLSVRDYFAIKFAAASCSRDQVPDFLIDDGIAAMAEEAYKRADAMLKERAK